MLENISSLLYVISREIFNVIFFLYVYCDYILVSKRLFASIIIGLLLGKWYYLILCNNVLTAGIQYFFTLLNISLAIFFFRHDLVKRLLLLIFLSNIGFLIQTLALVVMEQCKTSLPPFTLGFLVLLGSYIITMPLVLKFLNTYKALILPCKNFQTLKIAASILCINYLGTIILYDFRSVRDWSLLAGRCLNIIPALIFIQIIFYLIREQELNNNLNAKLVYLENLRSSEKKYFDYIIDSWKKARRLRHDIRHITLLIQGYVNTKQYDKLKELLQNLIVEASNENNQK